MKNGLKPTRITMAIFVKSIQLNPVKKHLKNFLQAQSLPIIYTGHGSQIYDVWIKSYGKIFDEFLTLPFRQNIKEIFEPVKNAAKVYADTFTKSYPISVSAV